MDYIPYRKALEISERQINQAIKEANSPQNSEIRWPMLMYAQATLDLFHIMIVEVFPRTPKMALGIERLSTLVQGAKKK
jgi:hypothetical protein